MIRLSFSFSGFVLGVAALAMAGCASPPADAEALAGGSALQKRPSPGSKADGAAKRPRFPIPPKAPGDDSSGGATASTFSCSPSGIAAYADALAKATQDSCTDDGVGVVDNSDYECIKTAIDQVAPPHPDKSYEIITTLLAPNEQYPKLECTYFVQAVTAGVCGTPISPDDMDWTQYPLATEFAGKTAKGYTWIDADGSQDVQAGDIFIYKGRGGQDPGHIMIVAEVVGDGQFRIAEANELNPDGSQAFDETGAVTNVRVTSLDDNPQLAGWFRLAK